MLGPGTGPDKRDSPGDPHLRPEIWGRAAPDLPRHSRQLPLCSSYPGFHALYHLTSDSLHDSLPRCDSYD